MTPILAHYMTPEELVQYVELFYSSNVAIIKKKNADYTAGNEDAHANFKALEAISHIFGSTEVGLLHRMMDKMMRIISFVKSGTLENESAEDSLRDLANYCAIFAALLASRKDN